MATSNDISGLIHNVYEINKKVEEAKAKAGRGEQLTDSENLMVKYPELYYFGIFIFVVLIILGIYFWASNSATSGVNR